MSPLALTAAPAHELTRPKAAPFGWSFKAGTLFRIPIYVHGTFLLLLAWLAIARWVETRQLAAVGWTIGLLAALFTCVLLHEFGHALVARRFGFTTSSITLLPIGGVARIERLPEAPTQALLVALAGPAVNVGIAAGLFALLHLSGRWPTLDAARLADAPLVDQLLFVNVMLAGFNLLPAFPMDGGRALQAILAARIGQLRATRVAARLGQIMAIWFAIVGALQNPMLLFIALFVWMGATQEAFVSEVRSVLAGRTAGDLATTSYHSLEADAPLDDAAVLMLRTSEPVFAVERDAEVVGLVSRAELLRALKSGSFETLGALIESRTPLVVDSNAKADEMLARLEEGREAGAVVVENSQVKGIVTMNAITGFLALHDATGDRALAWLPRQARRDGNSNGA